MRYLIRVSYLISLFVFGLFVIGCKNCAEADIKHAMQTSQNFTVSRNIKEMKENGLFDALLKRKYRAMNLSEDDVLLERFLNDTDNVINDVIQEINGEEQLKVIDALFNKGSAEEFAEALSYFDSEKAEEYLRDIDLYSNNEIYNFNERKICRENNLDYYMINNLNERAAYESNLNWDTIGWYTGFCLATTAGFYAMSCGTVWVRIAGIAAVTAGAFSMGIQLEKWIQCTELKKLVNSAINKDASKLTEIIKTDDGKKLILIMTETIATLFLCSCSAAGKALIKNVIDWYNGFIDKVLELLPKGVNYKIGDFPIKRIDFNNRVDVKKTIELYEKTLNYPNIL